MVRGGIGVAGAPQRNSARGGGEVAEVGATWLKRSAMVEVGATSTAGHSEDARARCGNDDGGGGLRRLPARGPGAEAYSKGGGVLTQGGD